jgi:hypothetical protein
MYFLSQVSFASQRGFFLKLPAKASTTSEAKMFDPLQSCAALTLAHHAAFPERVQKCPVWLPVGLGSCVLLTIHAHTWVPAGLHRSGRSNGGTQSSPATIRNSVPAEYLPPARDLLSISSGRQLDRNRIVPCLSLMRRTRHQTVSLHFISPPIWDSVARPHSRRRAHRSSFKSGSLRCLANIEYGSRWPRSRR